jgi:Tol biopolymer transport system component
VKPRKLGFLELGRRTLFGRPARPVVGNLPPAPEPSSSEDFSLGELRVEPQLGVARLREVSFPLESPAVKLLLMLQSGAAIPREHLAVRIYGRGGTFEHGRAFARQLARVRHVLKQTGVAELIHGEGDTLQLHLHPAAVVTNRELGPLTDIPNPLGWLPPSRRLTPLVSQRSWIKPVGWSLAVLVLIGTIALILFIDKKAGTLWGTPEALKVIQVLTLAGHGHPSSDANFSRDGQQLLYVEWLDNEHTQIVDLNLSSNQTTKLTDGQAEDRYPQWLPQQALIVFERTDRLGNCALLSLDVASHNTQKLSDCDNDSQGATASMPDGLHLTLSHRTALLLPRQLVSVGLKDSVVTGVTNPISGMPGDAQPSLTKDGQTLVFNRSKALGVDDIWALSHQSSAAIQLTHDQSVVHGLSVDFFDQSVVFSSERAGHANLWRSHLDGYAPEPVLASASDLVDPSVHPSGLQLAFTRLTHRTQTEQLNWSGGQVQYHDRNDAEFALWPREHLREPALSPDGRRWAAVIQHQDADQLVLLSGHAAPQALVTPPLSAIESPTWSRDGRYLVFSGFEAGQFNLYKLDLQTQQTQQILNDARSPSFAADGTQLYYSSRQTGHWQIYRNSWPNLNAASALTRTGGLKGVAGPDAHSLYYTRPDRAGIWQKDLDQDADERLLVADLLPIDWRNFFIDSGGIWFFARPTQGPVHLKYFGFTAGRVVTDQTLHGVVRADSGIGAGAGPHSLLITRTTETDRQLAIALLH